MAFFVNLFQDGTESLGIKFLRFDDDEAFYNIDKVLNIIEEELNTMTQQYKNKLIHSPNNNIPLKH